MAVNSYNTHAVFCYLAKRMFGIPLVMIPAIHVVESWSYSKELCKVLNYADRVIALTDFEKEFLVKRGIGEKKISVISFC